MDAWEVRHQPCYTTDLARAVMTVVWHEIPCSAQQLMITVVTLNYCEANHSTAQGRYHRRQEVEASKFEMHLNNWRV